MTAAARWSCPECGARLSSFATAQASADDAVTELVREHLALFHGGALANPVAAASWLAPAGLRAELYGGPHDGEQVWMPSGDLPETIALHRAEDGTVVPLRGELARVLPSVATYTLDPEDPEGPRYRYQRPQQAPA